MYITICDVSGCNLIGYSAIHDILENTQYINILIEYNVIPNISKY